MLKVRSDKIVFEGNELEGGNIEAREVHIFRSGRAVFVHAGIWPVGKSQMEGDFFKFNNRQSSDTQAKLVRKAVLRLQLNGDCNDEITVSDFISSGVEEMLAYPAPKRRKKA